MRSFLALLVVTAVAATSESSTTSTPTPSPTQVAKDAVKSSTNAFSLRLYQAVKADPGNLVISPLSAAVLLALTRHGAAGSTEQQLTSVLQLSADREATAAGYGALLDSLQTSGEAILRIANKMYAEQTFHLKDSFREAATSRFRAGAEEMNFANDSENARLAINRWVEDSTEGKIKDLFAEGIIDTMTRLVLVNAIYFKGGWWKPFEVEDTDTQPFHVSPTSQVNVSTMHSTFQLNYGELPALNAKAVSMPYRAGDADMSMIILLPNAVDGLEQVEAGLNQLDINNLTPNFGEVIMSLPKLRIESKFNLKDKLMQMGITEIFSQGANLTNIAEQPLFVDDVVQKTFIGVDEKGTEAAAATGFNMMLLSTYPQVEFKADHPFLFLIESKGTILFIGRVTNPTI